MWNAGGLSAAVFPLSNRREPKVTVHEEYWIRRHSTITLKTMYHTALTLIISLLLQSVAYVVDTDGIRTFLLRDQIKRRR